MCAIGVKDGIATGITAAFLGEMEYGQLAIHTHGPVKPGRVPQERWLHEIEIADERVLKTIREGNWEKTQERVMLVSTDSDESHGQPDESPQRSPRHTPTAPPAQPPPLA